MQHFRLHRPLRMHSRIARNLLPRADLERFLRTDRLTSFGQVRPNCAEFDQITPIGQHRPRLADVGQSWRDPRRTSRAMSRPRPKSADNKQSRLKLAKVGRRWPANELRGVMFENVRGDFGALVRRLARCSEPRWRARGSEGHCGMQRSAYHPRKSHIQRKRKQEQHKRHLPLRSPPHGAMRSAPQSHPRARARMRRATTPRLPRACAPATTPRLPHAPWQGQVPPPDCTRQSAAWTRPQRPKGIHGWRSSATGRPPAEGSPRPMQDVQRLIVGHRTDMPY